MEFKFNVNSVLKNPIVEINNNLIPPGFSGDRRALWDTLGKISEIVNVMGEASAIAQGLPKSITTAERLRNSDHKLYFLVDQEANNGKGAVTGMLKTGKKSLYIFDRNGRHYQVTPPCVLDFYIHESRQRTGLGKQLFEHMLQKEEVDPIKMAIDRPSEKLLGFLNKHYSLNSPLKQMNNYVVFDGFFPKPEQCNVEFGSSVAVGKKESANGLQKYSLPHGRYGAPRPPCSMSEIIHNQTTNNKNEEATGYSDEPEDSEKFHILSKLERPQSLPIQKKEEDVGKITSNNKDCNSEINVELTNIQKNLKSVKIEESAIHENVASEGGASNTVIPGHLTNQGYFDIKFYHNKLW